VGDQTGLRCVGSIDHTKDLGGTETVGDQTGLRCVGSIDHTKDLGGTEIVGDQTGLRCVGSIDHTKDLVRCGAGQIEITRFYLYIDKMYIFFICLFIS
jgi:hypothetical protein